MRYALGLLIAAVAVFSAQTIFACSCIAPPPPKKALEGASAVFMGKVKSIERVDFSVTVTFEVEKSFKGVKTKKVKVMTSSSGASCGYGFTKGEVYVVYCYGSKDKVLRTGLCTRTRPASAAKGDLDALGEGIAIE